MRKAGARLPTWMIGLLLMAPLVCGLDGANYSHPNTTEDVTKQERSKRCARSSGSADARMVGFPAYPKYHANDSLIGQPVPCSHAEKLCFRYNMLYHERYGCVDLENSYAKFSSGHLVPADELHLDCEGYVMAYDDKCYRKDIVEQVICGCDLKPTRHFIHGVECRCTPPAPIHVKQPEEEGRCRIPDLRFPDKDQTQFSLNPNQDIQGFSSDRNHFHVTISLFRCSPNQLRCFASGKVWAPKTERGEQGPGACRPLLDKAFCKDEHEVALDLQAAREGRVETRCVHVRGNCSDGKVRMTVDDKCHNEEDIKLITNGKLFPNQFGFFVIAPKYIHSLKLNPVMLLPSKMCAVYVTGIRGFTPYSKAFFPIINRRYLVDSEPPCPYPE